jgi:hypothetical protein
LNERYAAQVSIPLEMDDPEYIKFAIHRLKRDGAINVFEEIYNSGHPVVVETHLETWDDPQWRVRKYVLHYRLTAVRTQNITIPVFEYVNHEGIREWKCPACAMINIIDASFCGEKHYNAAGCGRPRDFVRMR